MSHDQGPDHVHDELESMLRTRYRAFGESSAGPAGSAGPDLVEVRRRLGAARRRRALLVGTGLAGVVAVVALVIVLSTSGGSTDVRVGRDPAPTTTGVLHSSSGRRRTAEGVELQSAVHGIPQVPTTPGAWQGPAACYPAREFTARVTLAGSATGGATGGAAFHPLDPAVPGPGVVAVTSGEVRADASGGTVGDTIGTVVVALGDSTLRHVKVQYLGGFVDEVDALDGMAVSFATERPGSEVWESWVVSVVLTWTDGRSVTRTNDRGSDINGVTDPDGGAARTTLDELGPQCSPAPATGMPDPGKQPSDPGARAAATAALETAFDGSVPIDDRAAVTDDPGQMRSVLEEFARLQPAMASAMRATVKDLVFTDATTAIVRFDAGLIRTASAPEAPLGFGDYRDQYGKVVLRDGAWRMLLPSMCRLVRAAGGTACGDLGIEPYPAEAYGQVPDS